eukprot:TRINITY_DN66893_c6_g2_i1.p1 TRINITY_DN66893_c6_g2~~TRINITY_DN66893_c6_g2_i1.p1  ORF type:complete len:191 (+),score=9.02 TRINITY_DN66893_c6_g2_i1:225-797(+)
MGGSISSAMNSLSSYFGLRRDVRIVLVGLDAAGKTTLLFKLKLGEVLHTTPTIGFNVETVQYKNLSFTMWDIGGQDRLRPLWRHYFEGSDAVIFVVDSNDKDRVHQARDELHKMMSEVELQNAHLLVFANKQDLPNALSTGQLIDSLGLRSLKRARGGSHNNWFLQGCCATTGEGLYEGLEWLAESCKKA